MLRTRGLSAVVIVLPLLVALAIGTPALAAFLAIVAALGAWEAFRLLRMAGYPSLHVFGTVLAVALVLEAAWQPGGDKGTLLIGAGAVLAGIGAFARTDARDGLIAWMATVFGAVYVVLIAFVLQVAAKVPAVPGGAVLEQLGSERGWVLLLILGVWSFDTGAFLVGRQIGRHKFLTHISPSKSIEGVIGGVVATTIVTALLLAGLGQAPLGALVLGPLLGLAA